ncbi:undecaprenyl-diphosphate phosphatase [Patescibacteria group bacterium]|nr:undecaprenyl-diphosphate phosphatase [Patescibacteria group bacterium]
MSFLDAILLGLVQGLAEFLPISSSGHLVIAQNLLGVQQASIFFEVFLHFATVLAILIYFKKDILAIKLTEIKLIIIGSIPAAIIGVLFKDQIEVLFESVVIVSVLIIVTGIINLITDRKLNTLEKTSESKLEHPDVKEIGIKEVLIIGIFQAFAILPGISRSGSTVAGGILQNIDRVKAFRFSFLMVIPVILGASSLQLIEVLDSGIGSLNFGILFVGGLTAFVFGFLSLKIFEYVIKKARLEVFGYYCISLGSLSLLLNYFVK